MSDEGFPRPGVSRRRFGAMLVGGFAASALTSAIHPAEAASDEVRIADLDWIDALRDRRMPACLHWPSQS